jgi:hypothetical protein
MSGIIRGAGLDGGRTAVLERLTPDPGTICAASTTALALGALAAAPGVASAASQQLNSVAISINADANLAVLDVAGSSVDPGASVIPWTLTAGSNQRWNFVPLPDGNEKIVNQNSGMCLTTDGIPGTPIYQQRCIVDGYGAGPLQEWTGALFPAIRYGTPYAGPDTSYLRNPVSNMRVSLSTSNTLIAAAGGAKLNYYQL